MIRYPATRRQARHAQGCDYVAAEPCPEIWAVQHVRPRPGAPAPRVIRTHAADWQRLRYGIDKPSKMGRPAQRDTEMLFFSL